MRDTIETSFIKPNQLQQFGVHVQDDPTSRRPLSIITPDSDFSMPIQSQGTMLYFTSHYPTKEELENFPPIHLSSWEPWNPRTVKFENLPHSLEEEVARIQQQQIVAIHLQNLNSASGL